MEKLTTGSAYSWALVTCLLGAFSLIDYRYRLYAGDLPAELDLPA
ncbi:phage holin family protein [Sodalis glossinidius]|nr:phage holin family protein [Sodalis glossinidius]